MIEARVPCRLTEAGASLEQGPAQGGNGSQGGTVPPLLPDSLMDERGQQFDASQLQQQICTLPAQADLCWLAHWGSVHLLLPSGRGAQSNLPQHVQTYVLLHLMSL